MLISDEYRDLNRQLHAESDEFGNDNFGWTKHAIELIRCNGYKTAVDYGCGKGNLVRNLAGADDLSIFVQEYDPAIEGKDVLPLPAEFVVCTDVLEHIEPVHLNAVLRHLRELTQKRLFLTIYTKPSGKTLADGRNAHLIVKDGLWWRKKLLEHFQVLMWEERGPIVAAELVAKKHTGMIKPKARRKITPGMIAYLSGIRDQINAASDTFSQIQTISMFEGLDDVAADLQGACDVIEHLDDIDLSLAELARLSLKCTFCAVKISDLHTEYDWRRVIEKRFRTAQLEIEHGRMLMVGAPTIHVQGVVAVGAVASDDRWDNVRSAVERFPKRIGPAAAHERKAILACYGPSLIDTIEALKEEAAQSDADVISVSGAHDFLISHGVVPRYHIECDPRPHKALNLDKPHPDVTYLVASVCHPDYFERLSGADIRLWHVSTAEHALRLIGELKEDPKTVISGGGSVGLRSLPLLYGMGYRAMRIFAMDCSFRRPEIPAEVQDRLKEALESGDKERIQVASAEASSYVQQWAGKHAGKRQDMCEVRCDEEVFISSPVLLTYATNFFETIQKVSDLDVRLYGHGLLQAMCRFYQKSGVLEPIAA